MELILHRFELPLQHTFTISRGSVDVQETMIVELRHGGLAGFGEATTNSYYNATLEQMVADLRRIEPLVADSTPEDPGQFWQQAREELADNPFAHCALDMAMHDLWGKVRGEPVYQLWGLSTDSVPASNYTIGIDSIDVMVEKMQQQAGWPIYKIKLGTPHDLEIIAALREHTDAVFRVDANCAWSVEETIENSGAMRELGVEFIEQPLPAEQRDEMPHVKQHSLLPLVADESCIVEADVDRCAEGFDVVNIKLVKCAGLTPARRMIQRAQELGLKVMVGCMTESTVGISAIAQLLPMLDYVDMDGAALLAEDIADGVKVKQGICHYPNVPGCGVSLLKDGKIPVTE